MKRIPILFLGLLIAMMTVNVATAKGRKHSSASRSAIPSASAVINIDLDNPDKAKATTGLELLYEYKNSYPDPYDSDITCEEYQCIYGKDAKVNKNGDNITIVATGAHAFYYYFEHYIATGSDWERVFGFKNKADRDKFYKQLLRYGYDSDQLYKTTSDGWYIISIDCA